MAETARLLVTGASGQVGGELVSALGGLGEVVAPARRELDLSDPESIRALVRAVRPRWIVNAGAYTAVDRAESEPELAFAVNAEAVRVMGEEARTLGAAVFHFSTDYVFDGQSAGPYREEDAVGPLGVYGASKLAGERMLVETGAAALVFRTSWVYGTTGKNFVRTILRLARERDELRVVGDQVGAPTWSRDLARMARHVIGVCGTKAADAGGIGRAVKEVAGVYHAAGSGETTWAEFAREAIRLAAERETGVRWASVVGITTAEYPTPAQRPANSRLDCSKLERVFGWKMMDWRESLAQVIAELAENGFA